MQRSLKMIYYYSKSNQHKTNLNLEQFALEFEKIKNANIIPASSIDKYKNALIDSYQKEENKIFNYTGNENYYFPITICNEEIRIHFNISKALSITKTKEHLIQNIPIEQFTTDIINTNNANILYMQANTHNYKFQSNLSPIIIIDFKIGNNYHLVIDGNHRVSYCKEYNISNINAIYLDYKEAIDLISSIFEKNLYSFYIFTAKFSN